MSDPFNFDNMTVEDVPHRTPDHNATAGDDMSTVDRPTLRGSKPGIFGQRTTKTGAPGARNVKPGKEKRSVPNKPGQFVERVHDLYMTVALFAMPFDAEISMYLMTKTPDIVKEDGSTVEGQSGAMRCAIAWDEAAQRNESVRRFLDGLLAASVWGALIAAHLPILFAIAKNHTPLGAKFDPAAAMEAMLRRQQEQQEQ